MAEKSDIDTELLQQYLDTLGAEGIQATLTTFDGIIQSYAKLLHQAAKERNEDELRKQAHNGSVKKHGKSRERRLGMASGRTPVNRMGRCGHSAPAAN